MVNTEFQILVFTSIIKRTFAVYLTNLPHSRLCYNQKSIIMDGEIMNRMEKLKSEKEGLSILPDIYQYAKNGLISDVPESDLFRMRWFGFFYRKKQNSFMVRIRVPSGKLSSVQVYAISELAQCYGDGTVALTTRMGLQIRGISLSNIPKVWEALRDVQLETRQTGFDNIRNFMNCPVAGIQKDEAFDASEVIEELSETLVGNSLYSNLPRKFNISVTGCHEDCGHSRISDIGLVPQVIQQNGKFVEGFRVRIGGAIGRFYATVARDLGIWLPKTQAVPFILAVLELFRDYGKRNNRKEARLLHLINEWGIAKTINKINEKLSEPLILKEPEEDCRDHHDHIGIYRQKQKGFYYAGLVVPTGKMTAKQFIQLAELSRRYGNGELRLTGQQNVIIPFIREPLLEDFKQESLLEQFSYRPSILLRSLITCTGKEGCDLAIVATKTPALKLIADLEERLHFDCDELRIHWSGCPNSCAIVQAADIGLHGIDHEIDGEFVDAVNIYYGGKIGPHAKMGTLIREKVPVKDLLKVLTDILTNDMFFKGIYLKKINV